MANGHWPASYVGYGMIVSRAEYVAAPSRQLARKPASLSHAEAAALPLAGLTAWQALVDTARVAAGQRVLIHGAGGGVGHLAVQIAKARGAHVIGTASAAKHDFAASLGADSPRAWAPTSSSTTRLSRPLPTWPGRGSCAFTSRRPWAFPRPPRLSNSSNPAASQARSR